MPTLTSAGIEPLFRLLGRYMMLDESDRRALSTLETGPVCHAEARTDIAREGENVIVYPCGDTAALAEALAILAADPAQRAGMAQRSLEIFDELDMRRSVGGVMAALDAVRR